MKRVTLMVTALLCLGADSGLSQTTRFLKRVENNYRNNFIRLDAKLNEPDGSFNLESKTDVERLLFGKINAEVEFYVDPSYETQEANRGLRILRLRSDSSCILEVKRVSNWKEVEDALLEEYPWQGTPTNRSISKDSSNRLAAHNRAMLDKREQERPKRYKVQTKSIPITDSMAKALHSKFSILIDNFKGIGRPGIVLDGEITTFRCVVGDDVWTLTVRSTQGESQALSDLCKQMITDAQAGQFEEAKYLKELGK